jgi:hypothetical protein
VPLDSDQICTAHDMGISFGDDLRPSADIC